MGKENKKIGRKGRGNRKGFKQNTGEKRNDLGDMKRGSEGMGSEGEKNLGSNSVRGGSNRFGKDSSYRGFALSGRFKHEKRYI